MCSNLLPWFVVLYCLIQSYSLQPSISTSSPTVWSIFSEIAAKNKAINLGQGFPDWDPPSFVRNSLLSSSERNCHQYTRPAGHPALIELLARRYTKHLQKTVDPYQEIAITVGASQALYLALTSFLSANDEIIIFEPFFDLYLKQIALTKAIPRFVPLGGKGSTLADPWALDIELLRRTITSKTKILLLNSPHNPTGKVFTQSELESIAEIVRENPQIIVISDEVYKYTVYNPLEEGDPTSFGHYHFAKLPDMWDRTITISSCGKTFSVTGWQVGWMVGPVQYIQPIHELLPCVQFCTATPMQEALAQSLVFAEEPYLEHHNYYEWLRLQFARKRILLEEGLKAIGMQPIVSHGGFFLMAELPIEKSITNYQGLTSNEPYDWQYCRYLANEYGVVGIPASPFFSVSNYDQEYGLPPMARFAFCKKDETLITARNNLQRNSIQSVCNNR